MVREYPVRKGIGISRDQILRLTKEIVGNAEIEGEHVIASYPGLKRIELYTDGKKLYAETENDPSASDPMQAVKTFNVLIEKITGYTSKERKKVMSKIK